MLPGLRSPKTPISDATFIAALRRTGYAKDEMCAHGFRPMASTLLNEQGYPVDAIEKQLAHNPTNKIRGIYNRAEYMPERRRIMQDRANYLDGYGLVPALARNIARAYQVQGTALGKGPRLWHS